MQDAGVFHWKEKEEKANSVEMKVFHWIRSMTKCFRNVGYVSAVRKHINFDEVSSQSITNYQATLWNPKEKRNRMSVSIFLATLMRKAFSVVSSLLHSSLVSDYHPNMVSSTQSTVGNTAKGSVDYLSEHWIRRWTGSIESNSIVDCSTRY